MSEAFQAFADALLATSDAQLVHPESGLALQWADILDQSLASGGDSADRADVELEANTWRLVQALYAERLDGTDRSAFASTSKDPYVSPETLVRRLIRADQDLSELQAFCSWLESAATADPTEPRRGYLPHTRLMLNQAARTRSSKQPATVGDLDPDATLRDSARWADEDEIYEAAFVRTLFELLRTGDFDVALDLCRQSDQSWRAASLSGFRFYRDAADPSADIDDDIMDDAKLCRGNVRRRLWKQAARKMAQNTSLRTYERALYGHLAGDVEAVLPACQTWEDELWAYANALLQTELDRRTNDSDDGRFWQSQGASDAGPRSTRSLKDLSRDMFERVQESQNTRVREAASHPLRIAQRYLVLGEVDRLFDEFTHRLEAVAGSITEDEAARLIRFFAHLALFLRRNGQPLPSSTNDILEAYTRVLEKHEMNDLIAYYASQLRSDEANEAFAAFLQRLHPILDSRQARYDQLVRAQEHHLDVADVARRTVQLILADAIANTPPVEQTAIFASTFTVSEIDLELIRSIEWLTFFEETHVDALRQCNALSRYFLAAGRPASARELLVSLPSNIPPLVAGQSQDTSDPLNSLVTEFNDYRLLFTCLQAFTQWSDAWTKRPAKKQSRLNAQPFVETITRQTAECHSTVLELLQLKWLHREEDTLDDVHGMNAIGRLHELAIVRQIYIPELVFRLHRTLLESHIYVQSNLQLAIDMAQIVADERLQLWREFIGSAAGSNRLADLLERIREASLAALDINNSPFLVGQHGRQ